MKAIHFHISKPEFVLKAYKSVNSICHMKNRYSSCIIIGLSGILEFKFDDSSVILHENDALFIPESLSYDVYCLEASDSLIINFHTFDKYDHPTLLKKIDKKIAEEYYEKLNFLLLKPEENFNMLISTYYRLFSHFFDNKALGNDLEQMVKKAEILILENFSSPTFSCDYIAKKLNISEVYLRKLFVKYRNMPPSKFLIQTRMQHARQLIIEEGSTISETYRSVGYSDIYQFSRAYKKYFGYAPSDTVKSHKKHDIF